MLEESNWIRATGSVRTGTSYEKFHGANPFWLVVECDRGLAEFYSDQIRRSGEEGDVNIPLAGAHISVVRNERPKSKDVWRASVRKRIIYEYYPTLKTNGKHWWLPVRSQDLTELRKSMGLFPSPTVPFHLTVAVVLPSVSVEYGKVNPTIQARINILESMKIVFQPDIWEYLPECQELNALKSKFL